MPEFSGILAERLGPAAAGRVVRINDHDPAGLRALATAGLGLGSTVTEGQLDAKAARAVWVTPI
jgi:hypothetical protein